MTQRATARGQAGISLVEMMVGIVVGLIIAIAITSSVAAIGKQFRITGAGASAAESAQLGLGLIDRDVRMAGAALFNGSLAGLCPSYNMFKNAPTQNGKKVEGLLPIVRITDGGDGGSDILDVMVQEPRPLSDATVSITKEMPGPSVLKVNDPSGQLKVGDFVMVASPPPNAAAPCTRIQVTGITGACGDASFGCQVQFSSIPVPPSNDVYNPKPGTYTKEPDYPIGSVLFRVPNFKFGYVRYRVNCNSLLRMRYEIDPDLPLPDPGKDLKCDEAAYRDSAIAAGVVMLQAQYGISTDGSDRIAVWEEAPTAAQRSAFSATQEDEYLKKLQRIKAVRVATVAQSAEVDSTQVTSAAPVVFDGSQTLDLSGLSLPPGKTWRNYRYRVHETVVPVRNSAWNR